MLGQRLFRPVGLRWPDFSDYRTRARNFYEPAGYAFAWIRDGSVTAQPLLPRPESDFAEFDLHFGRANPGLFHARFGVENENVAYPSFLRQRLIQTTDPKAVFDRPRSAFRFPAEARHGQGAKHSREQKQHGDGKYGGFQAQTPPCHRFQAFHGPARRNHHRELLQPLRE
jgi:hypothetical protein